MTDERYAVLWNQGYQDAVYSYERAPLEEWDLEEEEAYNEGYFEGARDAGLGAGFEEGDLVE